MRLRWACAHVCVCARVHRHTHTSLDLGFLCTKFRFLARIISRWTWPHGNVDYMYELALRARAAEGGACGMVWGHVSFWEGRRPRGGRRRGEPPAAAASPACLRLTAPAPALTRTSYVGHSRFCLMRISVLNFVRDVSPRSQHDAHS